MIVYLVLVTLTCCSYITCWVEKPRLAAEQEEKRSVSEKQQVFHKVWIKALWILQKTSLCFMSELRCYEYVQVLHFLFQLAQIKRYKKKFKFVRKKRRNVSSAARVTHLSAPRRSASLPAQKVSLPPRWRLLSRHPQRRASSCCQQRQRERALIQKKTKLKKFWYLIKSVSTLKITEVLREHKETTAQECFREISWREAKTVDERRMWSCDTTRWFLASTRPCARSCACLWSKCWSNPKFAST